MLLEALRVISVSPFANLSITCDSVKDEDALEVVKGCASTV